MRIFLITAAPFALAAVSAHAQGKLNPVLNEKVNLQVSKYMSCLDDRHAHCR
jgi:hypothetical protein